MRPTYGAGIFNFVWEKDDLLSEAQIIKQCAECCGVVGAQHHHPVD